MRRVLGPNTSPLWLLAVGVIAISAVMLLTVRLHRDDVAFIALGGEACAEAADCDRWVDFPIVDDDGRLISDGFISRAFECRASQRGLGLYCRRALEDIQGYPTASRWSPLFNPVEANEIVPWMAAAAVALTVAALVHTSVLRRSERRRASDRAADPGGGANAAPPETFWYHGTRRRGDLLEVRDRWQGLFGQNAWLTILLAAAAIVSPPPVGVLWVAALAFVALRFYPIVRFGPERIRWRNWFRWKEIPTAAVRQFTVEAYPASRAWIPVITAELDRRHGRRRAAPFIATFSFRCRKAEVIAPSVRAWADELGIPSDLDPRRMVWRLSEPPR